MSATAPVVLVVDDEPAQREVLSQRLTGWGYQTRTAADARQATDQVARERPDIVVSDVVLPGASGIDLLRRLRERDPTLPIILITAHRNVDAAVDAMKAGATDFLTKPIDPPSLKALLDATRDSLRPSGLVGTSAAIRAVSAQLEQLAMSDAPAILTGESGTGKEVAARTVHALSARRDGPFFGVNAAAIPEGLVESEIFGHERGAFTGANASRAGCFELAEGGTLLLDELAEMPLALQPKLLRILEEGHLRRLGGTREIPFDVRVLAATNQDLDAATRDGCLREDLLYRLNVFTIVLPPLRDRLEDLPILVSHFLHRINARHGGSVEGVHDSAMERLLAWHWPGNVRELRNVVERAVVLARNGWVRETHLPPQLTARGAAAARPLELPADTTLADAERLLVLATLERSGQNKAEAARRLGLDVKTIRNKLRAWGVAL